MYTCIHHIRGCSTEPWIVGTQTTHSHAPRPSNLYPSFVRHDWHGILQPTAVKRLGMPFLIVIRVCGAQGTFLVRPSLSLAGAMVLSVVVGGVVKHMALDGNQLDTRSLEVSPLQTDQSRQAELLLEITKGSSEHYCCLASCMALRSP